MRISPWLDDIKHCSVTVVGLGVSNLPLIDFLLAHGAADITARDQKTREALGKTADTLEQKGVRLILGSDYLSSMTEELIFRSPGHRPDAPEFLAAVSRGARLFSEMELFLELTPATVIGITGSDGKTTTTTVTGQFLEEECRRRGCGRVFVGGNIGTPLLPMVDTMGAEDFAVLELSSFQLQTVLRSPHVSAVTNVTPNHLNWHTDMEEYVAAKTNVFAHSPNVCAVFNLENEITAALAKNYEQPKTYFSSLRTSHGAFPLRPCDRAVYCKDGVVTLWANGEEHPLLNANDILLPGVHNLENYMTAIALTYDHVSAEAIRTVATQFKGVAHRLEQVGVVDGVTYINSSIDSSPTRTAAALSALRSSPIVICGGYDKNIPFAPLAQALQAHAKAVVLTGATAKKIRAALETCERVQSGELPIFEEPDFTDAVSRARAVAKPSDTVLLSPACASFDAFANFEERGNTFRRIVQSFSSSSDGKT